MFISPIYTLQNSNCCFSKLCAVASRRVVQKSILITRIYKATDKCPYLPDICNCHHAHNNNYPENKVKVAAVAYSYALKDLTKVEKKPTVIVLAFRPPQVQGSIAKFERVSTVWLYLCKTVDHHHYNFAGIFMPRCACAAKAVPPRRDSKVLYDVKV